MKKILLILTCFIVHTKSIDAQTPLLPGFDTSHYGNSQECSGEGAGDISHWIAYFNDNGENTSDCISNDWITIYFHNDGEVSVGSSFNPNCLHMPWVPCFTEIDFNIWSCCDYANNNDDDSSGGSLGDLECIFSPNCTTCPDLDSWLSCGFNCTGC